MMEAMTITVSYPRQDKEAIILCTIKENEFLILYKNLIIKCARTINNANENMSPRIL